MIGGRTVPRPRPDIEPSVTIPVEPRMVSVLDGALTVAVGDGRVGMTVYVVSGTDVRVIVVDPEVAAITITEAGTR